MPVTIPGSPVLEYYNDAKIFLTGGTGFIGKVVLEKMLRVCTNVNHFYILVRVKKGKDPQTRMKELFSDPLFEILRKERPDFEKKVTCIPGDVGEPRLGISNNDYDFLTNEVTHVIHAAATVRFNERLVTAIKINVFGTTEILELCKNCSKIKVLVHISTAFSHCHRLEIDEKYYDPPMTYQSVVSLLKALNPEQLDSITEPLIKPWPNTYAFTKAIAENIIKESGNTFPTLIFRPSIVMGTSSEPLEGWIDNFYGPVGLIVAAGAGLLRVTLVDSEKEANLVPVDLAVNALLCSAWEVGTNFNNNSVNSLDDQTNTKATETVPKIFNFVSPVGNTILWGDFRKICISHGRRIPYRKSIWYYTITLTRHKALYYFLAFFYHVIPALFFDGTLMLLGKEPKLWPTYKKIHTFITMMEAFALNTWKFSDDNVRQLWKGLEESDKKLFNFDMMSIDWNVYFERVVVGCRRYIFRESEADLKTAKRRMFFFWIAHRLLQFFLLGGFFWVISKLFFSNDGFQEVPFEESIISKPQLLTNST